MTKQPFSCSALGQLNLDWMLLENPFLSVAGVPVCCMNKAAASSPQCDNGTNREGFTVYCNLNYDLWYIICAIQ
jgi:hypothetical protein